MEKDKEFVVIELNPEKLEEATGLENYIFKSAMEDESWEKANYKEADMIISTAPQRHISEKIIALDTDAKKIVRSESLKEANQLLQKGADYVMNHDLLASEQLIDYVEEMIYADEDIKTKIRESLLEFIKKDIDELIDE